ncbi:hypothetical protein AW101_26675 [Escherichia coli]|nr:hypothetical protein AW091_26855 [Escherichia coli]OTD56992.1 hypothetical protein AW101_26675 [Escherichia coli]
MLFTSFSGSLVSRISGAVQIKSMVGISTDVMIVNCGSIPRSEGKACRVFDLRNIVGA